MKMFLIRVEYFLHHYSGRVTVNYDIIDSMARFEIYTAIRNKSLVSRGKDNS